MSLTTFKNRKWHRQRNDNDAYLEDLNQIVNEVNALPGTNTVLGYYATLAALTTAHPVGAVGQFAIVGNTIYIWDPLTSTWITIGDTLYKGVLDASAGIPYPAAQVGEFWRISVAGTIGSTLVEVGDQVICIEAYAGGMDDTKFMIVQSNSQVTQVTHTELLNLISNGLLENGRKYQISDFVQAYNIFDGGTNTIIEQQAGVAEALIVTATSSNTLAKEAFSPAYPQDIIYYDPNPTYLNTDIAYSDGAGNLLPQLKGVITYRHDTKQNVSTWYDFRNIKFRRWLVNAAVYDGGTAYIEKDVCKSGVDGKIYKCITATTGEGDPTVNTADWILWWDITGEVRNISWTLDVASFTVGDINTGNLSIPASGYQDQYTFGSYYSKVNNVHIEKIDLAYSNDNSSFNSTLNNIVFNTKNDFYTCQGIRIGENSFNMTFSDYVDDTTFGRECNRCVFGYDLEYNKIEDRFMNIMVLGSFMHNRISFAFQNGLISDGFSNNQIGNINESYNTKSSFTHNQTGNYVVLMSGSNCYGNHIGDYNPQVTLGDNCTGITIGEKNSTITLGANCSNLTFKNGCTFTNTNATALINTTFENGSVVNGLDFAAATHIKAAYSKTVFMNATPAAQLSYFNALNALTVVNVNA